VTYDHANFDDQLLEEALRDIKLILALAVFWLVGGAIVGAGIRAHFYVEWVMPCSLISAILGMLLLLVVMRDDKARRRLFGEANEEMPFKLTLAALFVLPVVFLVVGSSGYCLRFCCRNRRRAESKS
jgi:hypothetical protein